MIKGYLKIKIIVKISYIITIYYLLIIKREKLFLSVDQEFAIFSNNTFIIQSDL